jgi:signal transduction histidine kinase
VSPKTASRAVTRTLISTCAGLAVTLAVLLVPSAQFAYRSVKGHVALETAVTLVAALVALLLYGRYRRTRTVRKLLLVYALALLSFGGLLALALPLVIAGDAGVSASSWAALFVRLLGALLIGAAAVVPARVLHRPAHPAREVAALATAIALVGLAIVILSALLPAPVDVRVAPEASTRPILETHPLVLATQLINVLCFALAATSFTAEAARTGDDLVGWLGAGTAMGALARVNYLLFPSLNSQWVYSGDLLRLGFYVLLLVGAVQEIQDYWAAQTVAAAEAERRRLARDLHDGAIQELGYLRMQARLISDDTVRSRIEAASERALDEARRALAATLAPPDEPLSRAVQRAVCEVADRHDARVRFIDQNGQPQDVSSEQREAIVRIAREAVSNAIRHGRPAEVTVEMRSDRLIVRDDGGGFLIDNARTGKGFGLTSMRDRAEGVGATLDIESQPGEGTCVELKW